MSQTLTPPVPHAAAVHDDPEKRPLTQASLNDDVLKLISLPGKIWWAAFLFDLAVLAVALGAVRDGEIQTACAQSCPTQAITFGDLIDTESAVHKKSFGERRYWVFEELYTKPGVTYLQKVTRDTTGGAA